jgi:hypothetical protein
MESKKAARTGSPQNIFHNSSIYRTALHRTYFTPAAYTGHKGTGLLSTEHISQQQHIQDINGQDRLSTEHISQQ